jgi:EmrB/QacA subfamily drug resistance transporter
MYEYLTIDQTRTRMFILGVLVSLTLQRQNLPKHAAPGMVLALFATAQLMLVLDVTVVNVALPDIGADLGLSRDTVPWVMTTYTLFFGGLMLSGGRIADRLGPRRMALAGLAAFIASSAVCGLAQGAAALVIGRALQGASAALLSPAALAAALTAFPGERRGHAMSVWAALAGTGSALGVILGGVLTATTSWRWVFGINVPIGLALLVAIPLLVPEADPVERSRRLTLDLPGALLITTATGSAIYGLISAGSHGWGSARLWIPVIAALALVAAFVLTERHVREPLLHVDLFRRRPVIAGAFLMLTATGLLVGAFFLGSFTLQHAHQASALRTGLLFLPTAIATIAGAHLAGNLLGHVNARVVAPTGFVFAAAGFASPALGESTWQLVVGLAVAAFGIGAVFVTAFTASLGDAAPEEAGLRSAIVNTFHELGGAAGVAVLSTAAGTALVAAHPLAGDFSHAFGVGAISALVGAAVSLLLVPAVLRPAGSARAGH